MIIWIFMLLDLLSMISVGLAHFEVTFPVKLLLMSAFYLIVKGALFFEDFMSKVDIALGIYILIMAIFHFTSFVDYIIFGWFLYKLLFTLLE